MPADRAALVARQIGYLSRLRQERGEMGDDAAEAALAAAIAALSAPPEAALVQHEYNLIAAAVGERGKTDCSTPLYVRVQNLVKQWDRAPAPDCTAAVRAALLDVMGAIEAAPDATWVTGVSWNEWVLKGVMKRADVLAILDARLWRKEDRGD